MSIGLIKSIYAGSGSDVVTRRYVKDGLKLYMPYRGTDNSEVQFVGEGSCSFDGTNDYISVADDSTLDFGTGDFSVAGWFKWERGTASDDSVGYIAKWDGSTGWYLRPTTGDNWYQSIHDGAEAAGAIVMTGWDDGGWHHIAGVWDRDSTFRAYLDGVATTTIDITGADGSGINNAAALDIGGASGAWATDYWHGSIKNVAIWNRALTPTEVQNVMYKTYAEVSGRLASGLVSWWALDSSTDTYKDSHGSNDGTNSGSTLQDDIYGGYSPVIPRAIDNAPTVQADAIGSGSAYFDGVDDYISVADNSDIQIDGDMSIAFWMKRVDTAGVSDGLVVKRDGGGTNYQLDVNNSDGVRIFDGAREATSTSTIPVNTWTHVAWTIDSGQAGGTNLYINGVNDTLTFDSGTTITITANDAPLLFGHNDQDASYWYKGYLCQVGIWDAVLTQAQIQSIMEKTYEELTASEKEDLVSYWSLDETIESSGSGASFVYDKVDTTLGSEKITDFASFDGTSDADTTIKINTSTNTIIVTPDDSSASVQPYISGSNILAENLPVGVYKMTFNASWTNEPGVSNYLRWYNGSTSPIYHITEGENVIYGNIITPNVNTHFYFSFDNVNQDVTISNISIKPFSGNAGSLV
jgi:hypothetical protein